MSVIPETPLNAKQTNCWSFLFIVGCIFYSMMIMSYIAFGVWVQALKEILNLATFVICMYHTHHTILYVGPTHIAIKMGPWRWGEDEQLCCECCKPSWLCSSQIKKVEVISIERKKRHWFKDIILRGYCSPISWCCCHKSYSSYFWPCCCVNCKCGGLCDGDESSVDMIQFNLTEDPWDFTSVCCVRCAPGNLITCCVYNRIALSIKNQEWLEQLYTNGYPLNMDLGLAKQDAIGTGISGTDDNDQVIDSNAVMVSSLKL